MPIQTQEVYNPLYENKDKFIIILSGGRGSAKSFNVNTFIERLTFESGHKILFSRYTMASAGISIIPEFVDKIEREGTQNYFKINKTEITNIYSGSQVLFKGIKTSSGNQTANLKSIQGITTFVGDEMEEWENEDDFEKLILSIRKKGKQLRVILVLNPTNADHFIYRKYIEKTHKIIQIDGVDVQVSTHPDVLHLHTTYLDNLENLDKKFLDLVHRIKEESVKQCTTNGELNQHLFNKSKYAQNIIGRWADVAEGVIFTNWKEGDFDSSLPYCYGQDYGFTIDPDTLVKVAVDHKNKIIYLDEKYHGRNQLSVDDLYLLNRSLIDKPNDLIVGDSAEPRLIEDLRKKGLNIKPTKKYAGVVSASILKMLEYQIIVTPESNNLKKELRNYAWNNKKAGIPVDKFNHCFVGETMITTNKGPKRIDTLNVGDLVLTRKGYKSINKVFKNGSKKIFVFKLNFGKFVVELKATPDHKIKTARGWIALQHLMKGDRLYLLSSLNQINTANPYFVAECVLESIMQESETEREVYDIQVEEQHEYFANGVLVHNCIDASRYAFLELVEPVKNNLRSISSLL